MIKSIAKYFLGRIEFQGFFDRLHKLSLYGMQYGSGVFVNESGELKAVEYIRKKSLPLNSELILMDVGANKGSYSLTLHQVFSKLPHKIFCFEPSLEIYETLVQNTSKYPQIIPVQKGLGDVPAKLTLHKRSSHSGMNSVLERKMEHYNISFNIREEITLSTIDDFCKEHQLQQIDLLKLDVEGYEYKCLQGAKEMLSKGAIRYIQFEFGSTSMDARIFFQDFWLLLHDQYHFYRIVKNGLYPIKKYNERLEIFRNSNFLLEKKNPI